MKTDNDWMLLALECANLAEAEGEVPVGAIVVHNGIVIGRGYNQPIQHSDPTSHAEMSAIRMAAKHLGNYRLSDCTLYVTLEPCPMCAGAILHSRMQRLVYAAKDEKTGAVGGAMQVIGHPTNTHIVEVAEGVLKEPCQNLLKNFFKKRRLAQKSLAKQS